MKNKFFIVILIAFSVVMLVCCNKKNNLVSDKISDYTNLAVGKYIIYKLDSTVTLPFGVDFTTNSYTVKDSVEASITDNLNRPAYRIVRYFWDEPTRRWNANTTFMAIVTNNTFEFVENNRRQVRLVSPLADNFSWNGNSAMGTSPFNFSTNDNEYLFWVFSYANTGMPFTVGNQNFDTTITVVQYDSNNNKPFNPLGLSSYSRSYEVYAKGVGKVFQELLAWEYNTSFFTRNCKLVHCLNNKCDTTAIKCNTDELAGGKNCDSIARAQLDAGVRIICDTLPGKFSYEGYGVKLSILSHN